MSGGAPLGSVQGEVGGIPLGGVQDQVGGVLAAGAVVQGEHGPAAYWGDKGALGGSMGV